MKDKKEYLPLYDVDDVLKILNRISIFGGLSEKQISALFKLLRRVSYKENEYVFKQGDEPSHIYVIESGLVKIIINTERSEPLELVEFNIGDCFGETSVIGIQSHSASAIAVRDTELIVLPRNALLSVFESDKELFGMLILNIAREACRRLHKTDEILLHYVYPKH